MKFNSSNLGILIHIIGFLAIAVCFGGMALYGSDFVITTRQPAHMVITDRGFGPPLFVITERVADTGQENDKPYVDFYTAKWCVNCRTPAKILKEAEESLPFRIRKIDVDENGLPPNLPNQDQTIPHFQWKNENGNDVYSKWEGKAKLIEKWKRNSPKPAQQPSTLLLRKKYTARWVYPGDIHQHMKESHQVSGDYTKEELEEIHDLIHEGKPVSSLLK